MKQKTCFGFYREVGYWSKVIVIGVLFGVGVQFATAAWTPRPAGDPKAAIVPGPITTGIGQVKDGNLALNAVPTVKDTKGNLVYAAYGLIVSHGSVKVDSGDLIVGGTVITPKICLNGDCRTAWPVASGGHGALSCTMAWSGNQGGTADSTCPSGYTLTGGGFSGSTGEGSNTYYSAPQSNGWRVSGFSDVVNPGSVSAYAICCKIN